MKIKEIAFVCYAVSDLKKSRKFYEGILKLKPTQKWIGKKMGFIEYSFGKGSAHTLAIGAGAPQFKPSKTGAVAGLEVEDFDKAIKHLEKNKVKFSLMPQDTPVCNMAVIFDPDQNPIMIHRRKEVKWPARK